MVVRLLDFINSINNLNRSRALIVNGIVKNPPVSVICGQVPGRSNYQLHKDPGDQLVHSIPLMLNQQCLAKAAHEHSVQMKFSRRVKRFRYV